MALLIVLYILSVFILSVIAIPYHVRFVLEKETGSDLFLISLRWTRIIFEISFLGDQPTFNLILFGKSFMLPRRWFMKKEKEEETTVPVPPAGGKKSGEKKVQPNGEVPAEPESVYRKVKKYWIFVKPGKVLFGNLFRTFEFEKIDIDLHYGHKDPSVTGSLYGWYWASFPLRTVWETLTTRFRPDFQKELFWVRAEVEIQFWLYRLLKGAIQFAVQASMEWLHRRWNWIPKPSY
jgi:hypothetical protein